MPIIFIHGVNTRNDEGYYRDLAARDELLRYYILRDLTSNGFPLDQMDIVSPYWGKYGVTFGWDQASVPSNRPLEHLGPSESETPESDLEIAATLQEMAETGAPALQPLGPGAGAFRRAATADLPRLIEAVLSPIILSEQRLPDQAGDTPALAGRREAILLRAGDDVAHAADVRSAVSTAASEREIIDLLEQAVEARFAELLAQEGLAPTPAASPAGTDLEPLGPGAPLWDLRLHISELFDRAQGAPARAATMPVLDRFRGAINRKTTRFLGDVFVYLNARGDHDTPGPIVATILDAITGALRRHPAEPLIVITHSMGGNIFYDIATYYAPPDFRVEAWVSVASQVGLFEEMKLFKASDPTIGAPDKVAGLAPHVGYWLNVYDEADILSFLAAPVFTDVREDLTFDSGESTLQAHGAYFKRPSFYETIAPRLRGALS